MPFFSTIIPTFNRSEQVQTAIESVLSQDFKDNEIIIVDDGSNDQTAEILEKKYGARIKVLSQENEGVSSARNTGIKEASGEWLAFLDSDDLWLKNKLSKQYEFIKNHPEFLISQTQEIWIRNQVRVNQHKKHAKKSGDLFVASLTMCEISPSSVIIHRSIFDEFHFDENFPACEDYDLWLQITQKYQIGLIQEALMIRHGGHSDQLSFEHPVMDRFRIYSIIKLIMTNELSNSQLITAKIVLKSKWNLLLKGAEKRGNDFDEINDLVNIILKGGKVSLSELQSGLLENQRYLR